jgi:hypothetical protein
MMRLLAAIVLSAAVGDQGVPPSIRAASPSLPPEAERAALCRDLKDAVADMKKDVVWYRQPFSAAEVRALERMRASMSCPDASAGPLAGTWRIVGTSSDSRFAPIAGTVTLKAVDHETGRKLADEPNWGIAASYSCRDTSTGSLFYYVGTIVWDKGSLFDKSFTYKNDQPSTVILCTTDAEATIAKGNFRDSREAHGGFIQWTGTGEGYIAPERPEGPTQTFKPTRG